MGLFFNVYTRTDAYSTQRSSTDAGVKLGLRLRRVLGSFYRCAKFGGIADVYSFEDTRVSTLCEFCLKKPIHAHFGGVWEVK